MEEKYNILFEKVGNGFQRIIWIEELTDDLVITFSDFSPSDMPDVEVKRTERNVQNNKFKELISEKTYKEINLCGKIRAKVNGEGGFFSSIGNDLYTWEKQLVPKSSPLLYAVIVEKEDHIHAKVKVLLTFDSVKYTIHSLTKEIARERKFILAQVLYSGKRFIQITLNATVQKSETYQIPVSEFENSNSILVLYDILKYRKDTKTGEVSQKKEVEEQPVAPKENESTVRKSENQNQNEQLAQFRAEIKSNNERIKALQVENERLSSEIKKLKSSYEDANERIRSLVAEKSDLLEKANASENYEIKIAELKPYQDFFYQYSENKSIEKINSDFEILSQYRNEIENFYQNKENIPLDQKTAAIFSAFTELNRILLAEDGSNNTILDKFAEEEKQFKDALNKFRELLDSINRLIINSCKSEGGFSLEQVPTRILSEINLSNNYAVVVNFYQAFLHLNILFSQISAPSWNTLLGVLENLRKLVNIKSGL